MPPGVLQGEGGAPWLSYVFELKRRKSKDRDLEVNLPRGRGDIPTCKLGIVVLVLTYVLAGGIDYRPTEHLIHNLIQ